MKLLVLSLFLSTHSFADKYLIKEMESLKASLELSDPGKQELTLRLADLYFDVSIQEGDQTEHVEKIEQRQKALDLYTDVLQGRNGVEKVNPQREILIKYQVARVYRKLSRVHLARNFFKEVYQSELASKRLKREAAFSLAEYYEEEAKFVEADSFYLAAIELCDTKESCNLSHYKRAWLLYKEIKIDEAIAELKQALFDKNEQVREKVINDLMLFFSNRTTDGSDEVAYIQTLVTKTGKQDLIRQLVEAFYSAGNRVAGATALVYLNSKKPNIFYEMRLLEEYYGFRDWQEIERYLSALEARTIKDLPAKQADRKELQEMLKRVVVQFGSEAEQDPEQYSQYLRRAIDRYLDFYPASEMRKKMQQGWLKAQPDKAAKVVRLERWIKEDIALRKDNRSVRKLRQTRLALAQELNLERIVFEESLELANLLKGTEEAREFNYIAGLYYYNSNNLDFALVKFLPLAEIKDLKHADNWAILSQNLSLDIYNQRKNFAQLAVQADKWLKLPHDKNQKNISEELASMAQMRTQSRFEYFVSLGKTSEALENFYQFCLDKVYPEKSCKNAKVLAIELKDQPKLVALLERENDDKSLMIEYERMGRFSDAAKLIEKFELNRKSSLSEYFKVAALYEIDQDFKNRDRILNQAIRQFKKPLSQETENAFFLTLDEAGLITEKSLLLPWSSELKIKLANRFSQNRNAQKLLAASTSYAGPAWSKMVLEKVESKFNRFNKYRFYGRNSQAKFKRKEKRLENLVAVAKSYLEKSDLDTRIYLLDMLKRAYLNFGTEIMSTPLPEGLTEEIRLQVQGNLTQLATPYLGVADDYKRLLSEQLLDLENDRRALFNTRLNTEISNYAQFIKDRIFKVKLTADYDYREMNLLKRRLIEKPYQVESLEQLEDFYLKKGNKRLAGYFRGRVDQLKEKI